MFPESSSLMVCLDPSHTAGNCTFNKVLPLHPAFGVSVVSLAAVLGVNGHQLERSSDLTGNWLGRIVGTV